MSLAGNTEDMIRDLLGLFRITSEPESSGWVDLAGLLGPLGVMLFFVARAAARGPLYPLKDPRLAETVKVENL